MNTPQMIMKMLIEKFLDSKLTDIISKIPNKRCAADLSAVVDGLRRKQLWAANMVDASSKVPEGLMALTVWQMGNYEQCLRVQDVHTSEGSFSAQHCMVRLCISEGRCVENIKQAVEKGKGLLKDIENPKASVTDVLPTLTSLSNTSMIRSAVCVPSSCSTGDVEALVNAALSQLNRRLHASVVPEECHTGARPALSLIDDITLAFFAFFVALIFISTAYDLTHTDPGSRNDIYVVFSAYTNLKKIVKRSESSDSNLLCLHGVRVISIMLIVLGHSYLMSSAVPLHYTFKAQEMMQSIHSSWILTGFFSVDTFFLLSGLLLSFVFLNVKAERKPMNFKIFYLHRFFRLTPALAAVLLLQVSLVQTLNDGPVWHNSYRDDCSTTWWRTLFYIRNLFPNTTCMSHAWYLTADTQLYCLSPLLLILLWRNPDRGRLVLAAALFFSWLIPFSYAYLRGVNTPMQPFALMGKGGDDSTYLYTATENRFGPWIMGIWLGHIIHRLKTGQLTIRMSKILVAFLWIYVVAAFIGCVFSNHPYHNIDYVFKPFLDPLYNSLVHLIWSSSVFILILACVTGHGGPINQLLSLPVWTALSRLTYGIYLIHPLVLRVTTVNTRYVVALQHKTMIFKFISTVIFSTILAAVISLMFESPIAALEKQLFTKGSKNVGQSKEDQAVEDGSIQTDSGYIKLNNTAST